MDKESERWNYKPPEKVQLNPMFSRSISIRAIFDWYASYWFQLSTTTLALILAFLAWLFFFPFNIVLSKVELGVLWYTLPP